MPDKLKNLGRHKDPEKMHREYIDGVTKNHPDLFDEEQLKKNFDSLFGLRYVKAGEYTKKPLLSLKPIGVMETKDVPDNDMIIIQYAGEDIWYFENTEQGKTKLYDFLSFTVDHYLKEGERTDLYETIANELAVASIEYEASRLQDSVAKLQPGRESPAEIRSRTKDTKDTWRDINAQNKSMEDLLTAQLTTLQRQFNLLTQKHDDLENTQLQAQMNVLLDRVVKLRKALTLGKYSKKGSPEVIVITYTVDGIDIEQTADQVDAEIKDLQKQIDQIAQQINQQSTWIGGTPASTPPSKSTWGTKWGTSTAKDGWFIIPPSSPSTSPTSTSSRVVAWSSTPRGVDATWWTPRFDVFKFELRDGSESARSYLTRSGIPESHLNRFADSDRRDVKNLNDARTRLDDFKRTAKSIQEIYIKNPSLDIPPADVSTNPKAIDKDYREIAKLYKDLQAVDILIATELTKRIKGNLFTYHLLNDADKEWSDVLMGKKKDTYTWSRFSPDYGRARTYLHDNTYNLGRTQGEVSKSHEEVKLGREWLVTRGFLMDIPLSDLILKANTLSVDDASTEAQTIRLAMLESIIKAGSTASERNHDGSIRNVPMEEAITMLGNGNKDVGHTRYRELMRAVMMTEKFQQDLNVNYTNSLKVTRSRSTEKLQANKSVYLHDYFQFPDPTQEDALLLNAFVYTLGKEMALQGGKSPITGTELKYMFDMYKGADGVLDPSEPASRIREIYTDNTPNRDLWAANTRDVFKAQWVNGALRIWVLTPLIEKGVISSKTAANISSFANGAVNIAKFGVGAAAIVNGIIALWHTWSALVKWIFGWDSKSSRDKARAATKRGVKFGLWYEGIKFLQKPNQYRENSMIRNVRALFDPDLADKVKQEQQINSKELITVYTKQRALNNTIGTLSAGQLTAKGILIPGNWPDKIAIDMDKFVDEFPVMERELQKEWWRPAVKWFLKELEKLMVNDYQLTWPKLEALKTNPDPLNTLFGELDLLRHQVSPMNTLLNRELGKGVDIDMLSRLSDVERQKYIERLWFVSQQLNKFTWNPDWLMRYSTNPPLDMNILRANMRLALTQPKSVDGSVPLDGIKVGLAKFLDGAITEQQYFEWLRQVFADNTGFPIEKVDPTTGTKVKDPLYVSPASVGVTADFTTFLHDPTVGNAAALGGAEFIASPTIGSGAFINTPPATPFDPASQSWKNDLY